MATNLLDLAKQAIPPSFTDMAAGLIGESPSATGSALGAALPALIAGIAQKGSSTAGAQSVMALLDNPTVDTSLLSNLGGMFSGAGAKAPSVMSAGSSLVSSLFGDRAGALGGALASMSGMRSPQSGNNLIALAAPIVLAVIKRFLSSSGQGASGLASLLGEQGQFLQGALDSRLTGALGFASPAAMLSSLGSKAAGAAQAAYGAAAGTASAAAARTSAAADAAAARGGSWIGRWWPWILAALIILFLLYRCTGGEPTTQNAVPPAPAPAPATPPTPAPAPAPTVAMPTSLPAKVYFDVGSTTLGDSGKATVAAIAGLAKAAGGSVDVTGYADSTGDPAQNAEIAKNRAMAVRDALEASGVAAASINMKPPANFTGTGGDAEARRVEVSKTP